MFAIRYSSDLSQAVAVAKALVECNKQFLQERALPVTVAALADHWLNIYTRCLLTKRTFLQRSWIRSRGSRNVLLLTVRRYRTRNGNCMRRRCLPKSHKSSPFTN
ncbi:MAG: hypothetical protein GTO41_25550 [Burkholderiales bacterium]|nr:hypothetical protein [Burkholderiales bacterium]